MYSISDSLYSLHDGFPPTHRVCLFVRIATVWSIYQIPGRLHVQPLNRSIRSTHTHTHTMVQTPWWIGFVPVVLGVNGRPCMDSVFVSTKAHVHVTAQPSLPKHVIAWVGVCVVAVRIDVLRDFWVCCCLHTCLLVCTHLMQPIRCSWYRWCLCF